MIAHRRTAPFSLLAVFALVLLLAVPALARPVPAPTGPPLFANDSTPYWQIAPTVAPAADGAFLAVWEDMRAGLVARFLGAPGTPLGAEQPVVANTPFPEGSATLEYVAHQSPALAALPDGGFLLVWLREESTLRYSIFRVDKDIHQTAVVAQRLSPAGVPVGEPQRVDVPGGGAVVDPSVAVLADGRAVVVWEEEGAETSDVVARVVDASGEAAAAPVRVNTVPAFQPALPAVAATENGFAVAWNSEDGDGSGVLARSYSLDGTGSAPIRLNVQTRLHQSSPFLVAVPGGGFLASWQHTVRYLVEYRIHGRFVGADGTPAEDVLQLSPEVLHADSDATLLPLPDGGYYLVWLGWRSNSPSAFAGQALSASGERVGEPFALSDRRPPAQDKPAVAVNGDSLLVAWESWDGGGKGVEARALAIPQEAAPKALRVVGASQ